MELTHARPARTVLRRFSKLLAPLARWLVGELRELVPAVLFFFIAFLLILVLLKAFVAQYSIEFYAFSKAAVGALVLGKVALLMNWMESGHAVSSYPRAVVIGFKTAMYALAVILLRISERVIYGLRQTGNLSGAIELAVANANFDRLLAMVLLISLTVCSYLVMVEIEHAMGKGALFKLFFTSPKA